MTEQALNTSIGNFFRGIKADVCRVENGVGAGMPDINICLLGMEVWIESKIHLGSRGVLLRKEQYAWGLRRANAGGSVFVVAFDETARYHVWHYPHFQVVPVAGDKYVRISSEPQTMGLLSQVKKILFPCV